MASTEAPFTFSDAVLKNALEAVWQFLENRGAERTRYEKAVELKLKLYYYTHPEEDADEVRMLRTTADWANGAWEYEDHGYTFEVVDNVVTCDHIGPDRAREELLKLLMSVMAICGTKRDCKKRKR
jgi:hypothetical protein